MRGDFHAVERDRGCRLVTAVAVDERDAVGDILSGDDLAEHSVLAVEPWSRVRGDDEELGAVRVGAGVRHCERALHDFVVVELVLELVPRAAGAGAEGGSALDHEFRNHAVVRSHPLLDQISVRWGGGEAAAPASSLSGSAA